MFGEMTRSCTQTEGFLLSQADAKRSVNLFHVVKRGNPKNIQPSVSFIKRSLFGVVKRGVFSAGARVYQAPDMSKRSGRRTMRHRKYAELVL